MTKYNLVTVIKTKKETEYTNTRYTARITDNSIKKVVIAEFDSYTDAVLNQLDIQSKLPNEEFTVEVTL